MVACSGLAHAQSSVTLYGRLDTGIQYLTGVRTANGSKSVFGLEDGNGGVSFFGLRGAEDLGSGTQAIFQLDTMFSTLNGSIPVAGDIWARHAYVGLTNPNYGTLHLGEEPFIANEIWIFDPFMQSKWSSASLVHGRNWPISNNNISYRTPTIGGFQVYGQYSLSNSTSWNGNGSTPQGRQAGISMTYTAALFQLGALYDEIRDPANGRFDNVYEYSREYTLMGNVFAGPVRFQLAYQTSHAPDAAIGTSSVTQHGWAGATWQVNPFLALVLAAYHINANNGGGSGTLYTFGGSYSLSKRTSIEWQAATVRNSKTASFGLLPVPYGNTNDPLAGHTQSGVYAEIRHLF
nr:porin [Paraburkholderia fynbosensis]